MAEGTRFEPGSYRKITVRQIENDWVLVDPPVSNVKCVFEGSLSPLNDSESVDLDVQVKQFVRTTRTPYDYLRVSIGKCHTGSYKRKPENKTRNKASTSDDPLEKIVQKYLEGEEFELGPDDNRSLIEKAKDRAKKQQRDVAKDPKFNDF